MSSQDNVDIKALSWPASMLGEAIELLAQKGGLAQHFELLPSPSTNLHRDGNGLIEQWVEAVASHLKLEAEPITAPCAEIEQLLYNAGPALLQLPISFDENEPRFLALLKGNKRRLSLVTPDSSLCRVQPDLVRSALCCELETPVTKHANHILTEMGISKHRRALAKPAVAQKQIGTTQIDVGWILRLPPGANLWTLARRASLLRWILMMIVPHIIQQALELGAWAVIGKAAFSGRFDWAWLWAWALLLFTAVFFGMLSNRAEIPLVSNLGGLFKWKLLYGALQLEPDDVRHQGAGQFMGRVLESQWLELLAVGGGLGALLVGIVLFMATVPLFIGTGNWYHAVLLGAWAVFAIFLTRLSYRRTNRSINAYRDMTNDLVEQMVGHRTRLAQQDIALWHNEEDQAMSRYVELCKQSYPTETMLLALIPRGWMLLGLSGIAYAFIAAPDSSSQVNLAISAGAILLVFQSLTAFVQSIHSVATALAMRMQIEPLLQASARPREDQITAFDLLTEPEERPTGKQPILTGHEIDFRYRTGGHLVLQGCNVQICEGDRWLLEGPSGGGKSTLAALLAGLRTPQSGLIQLRGFDRQTVSTDIWRRRIVIAPQFHENHVFTESLAFNLLMGRRWPPLPKDLLEADAICRELGLGDLLDRMPDGLLQIVGEGGWRLSHGECSRLYIARAILQKADLIILDESFGSLDPESLQQALLCVHNRAPTLLVIAHP